MKKASILAGLGLVALLGCSKSLPVCDGNNHKEYGVFATDDANVSGPEISAIFYDTHLYCCPYHNFSSKTRIDHNHFRVGNVPTREDWVKRGFMPVLESYIGGINENSRDMRVAMIFFGDNFYNRIEKQLQESEPDTVDINGYGFRVWKDIEGIPGTRVYETIIDGTPIRVLTINGGHKD